VTACAVHAKACGQFATCTVRVPLRRIRERIVEALSTCTVSEMASDSDQSRPVPDRQEVRA